MLDWFKRAPGWAWSNLGNLTQVAVWLGAIAVTAWAAKAANLFAEYAPLSWVSAGLLGGLVIAVAYRLIASGRARWIRSKYDNAMMLRGGLVDPLAKTFERKRIYLSEFVLPSHPWIEGKTFIDCEIIGPANVLFVTGNSATENRLPHCDAIALAMNDSPYNAIFIRACTFRGCSFLRLTFLISAQEYEASKDVDWLHWIGHRPGGPQALPLSSLDANLALQPPQDTGEETQQ